MVNRSGKMKFVVQLLKQLKSENKRVLLFSRSKVVLNMLQKVFKIYVSPLFLFFFAWIQVKNTSSN